VVEKGHITLDFVEGTENPTDILTKNLGWILFEKFSHSLRIHFLSPRRSWTGTLIEEECWKSART
jgi:hypothetical protein